MMNEALLSRREFSEFMGVSISTVEREIKKDKWPFNAFIKVGKQLRYPASLLKSIDNNYTGKIPGTDKAEGEKEFGEVEVEEVFNSITPYIKTMLRNAPANGSCNLNLSFNSGKLVKINESKETEIYSLA